MFKKIGLSVICAVGLGILSQQVYAGNEGKTIVKQGFDPQSVVYVTNRDSSDIAVIDMKTNKVIERIACGNCSNPHMTMATMDGKRLLTTGTQKNYAVIVDLQTRDVKKVRLGIAPEHFVISHDGRWAYVGDMEEGAVSIVDLVNNKEVNRIPGFYEPHGFSMLPDMSKVYVSNLGAHEIGVIDVKSNKVITTFPGGEGMTGINFVNGGKKAYIISQSESALYVIDLEKYKELKRIKFGEGLMLETATTTPDGKSVYLACSTNNSVYVIDGTSDNYTRIPDVGLSPWAVEIIGGNSYCH